MTELHTVKMPRKKQLYIKRPTECNNQIKDEKTSEHTVPREDDKGLSSAGEDDSGMTVGKGSGQTPGTAVATEAPYVLVADPLE